MLERYGYYPCHDCQAGVTARREAERQKEIAPLLDEQKWTALDRGSLSDKANG